MNPRPSIRRRLLLGLLGTVTVLWCVTAWMMYRATQDEVEEVYDANLSQNARGLATLLRHEAEEKDITAQRLRLVLDELGTDALPRSPMLRQMAEELLGDNGGQTGGPLSLLVTEGTPEHRYESKIAFHARTGDQRILLSSPNAPRFDTGSPGFTTQNIDGVVWRVFTLHAPHAGIDVQVAEEMQIRDELIGYVLSSILWPSLVALPLLSLLIWVVVGRGLRPLYELADKLQRRDPDSLQPFAIEHKAQEVLPMVLALNTLFEKVAHALENERRFTANAAHELRTPLAALKVQAQSMQLGAGRESRVRGLDDIVVGVDRVTHLVEQLLALARADSGRAHPQLCADVDLVGVVIEVVEAIGHLALRKDIDLAFVQEGVPRGIKGDSAALAVLLRNLIDNAVRYTQPGGMVEVRIRYAGAHVVLSVSDNGPGIPESQYARLFERFQRGGDVRTEGSGLGLSIVRQIVELHGASVTLAPGQADVGLLVEVVLPG